jgi:DNA-binding CsgD family transcriptional regulator
MSYVSPVLVGRHAELEALTAAVSRARHRTGTAVFVVGEPGIGKTRLATAATSAAAVGDALVLRCRSGSVPLRAITETVFAALRANAVTADQLGEFWPVLWRLVTSGEDGLADPPLVRAEAVLRLLAAAGTPHGCVVHLDDLHEADADTRHVVDYLIDNIAEQPVALIVTLRAGGGPALDLATAAAARRTATLLRPRPLTRAETTELAGRCLTGTVPDEVAEQLFRDCEGNPFVLEELLAALVGSGNLRRGGDGWEINGSLRTGVPATVTGAVLQRVDRLTPDGIALLRAAAVLGRRFSLSTATTVAGLSADTAAQHMRAAADARLAGPCDGDDPDRYAFQHALTADAILTALLPGERAHQSRRAAAAVDDERLAAELWAAGGDPEQAAVLYGRAGRRAAGRGALAEAVALLERGLGLHPGTEPADLLDDLVRTLVLVGDAPRAAALGERLDAALLAAGAPAQRRIAARLTLARAAGTAGAWQRGLDEVAVARTLAGSSPADAARIDAVAAHLLLSAQRPGRQAEAEQLAEQALKAAEAGGPADVACEALEVLSRCARGRDLSTSRRHAERALDLATRHDLPIWRMRAMVEIGTVDKYRAADPRWLQTAREAATEAGAIVVLAWIDLHLAHLWILRGELDEAERCVHRAATIAGRLRLRELEVLTGGVRAAIAACRGDQGTVDALLGRGEGRPVLGYGTELWGHVRGLCALFTEEHERAMAEFGDAMAADLQTGQLRGSGYIGVHLLLRVLHGRAGRAEYEQLAGSHLAELLMHRVYLAWTRAVLLGREGDPAAAGAAAEEALRLSAETPAPRHLGARLVAPEAIDGGWGEPMRWLHDAEEYFHRAGAARPAAACRALLRGAGTAPRQRRTGHETIPEALRRAGVTVREYEVLTLLGDRMGNIEIAERLFLSPRTVERHVASLRQRTGQPDRARLIAYAREHLTVR